MLVYNCKDNYNNGSDERPSEETDLSPLPPGCTGSWSSDMLTGKEGVFFFDIAFGGGFGGRTSEERLITCHNSSCHSVNSGNRV